MPDCRRPDHQSAAPRRQARGGGRPSARSRLRPRRSAGLEAVRDHHFRSLARRPSAISHQPSAIGHRPAAPAGAGWCCGPLPSITARNRPRRTAWCNSTPRHSSPRQRQPPGPTCRSSGTRRWAHRRTCVSTPSPASTPLQQRADLLREGQRAHSKTSIYPPALGRCATQCSQARRYVGWRLGLQFRETVRSPVSGRIRAKKQRSPMSLQGRRPTSELRPLATPTQALRKASLAADTVAAMSPVLCAALTKPASYSAGARYTPRSSMAWKKRLKRSLSVAITTR